MASILKVDTIQDQAGNNIISEAANVITIGASGDTITVPAGATVSGFTSAGIDDNATSVAITIDSSERVGLNTTTPGAKLEINSTGSYYNTANQHQQWSYSGTPFLSLYMDAYANPYFDTDSASGWNPSATMVFKRQGSEKFRITSDGKVGIGTSSPEQPLHIQSDSGIRAERFAASAGSANLDLRKSRNATIGSHTILQNGDGIGAIIFRGSDGTSFENAAAISAQVDGTPGTDDMPGRLTFSTTADGANSYTERMRIDSSGNLFVATTTEASDDVGHALLANGAAYHTTDGTYAGLFNRKSSDGEIVQIRRNNTLVGSLDTVGVSTSGRLVVKSTTFDGYLDRAGTTIAKWMSSSFTPGADNTFDLGRGAERWQDIYLSGGAYIGGTGTANKLEDYEEGTFTPNLSTSTGVTLPLNSSIDLMSYTKIGRVVHIQGLLRLDSLTNPSGAFTLFRGLPFTTAGTSAIAQYAGRGGGGIYYDDVSVNPGKEVLPFSFSENQTQFNVYKDAAGYAVNDDFQISLTYFTD